MTALAKDIILQNQDDKGIAPEHAQQRDQMKIVIVGHVDHGKSTLIGRIFHDTDSLPEGKLEQITGMCEKRGMPFEYSFLMDALQAERDQGITIDTTQIWFKTQARNYVIIDAPGHKEFLKNMISGAASAEAAVLVIDAHEGVQEQSRRHGYLLHLLGVKQVVVAVNKMDLVDYSEDRFRSIEQEYTDYLASIGVKARHMIPVSAREGDLITESSANMAWYDGPAITEALDGFETELPDAGLPLRFPVQDVYKFDERRIVAGRIETGSLKVGDTLLFSPRNRATKIKSIERIDGVTQLEAHAGESVGITLEEQLFIERGHIASHIEHAPVISNRFSVRMFWLGDNPLKAGARMKLKLATAEYPVEIRSIDKVINTESLDHASAQQVERNEVAEVTLRIRGMACLDDFTSNHRMGRFVLVENYHVVGGGIISTDGVKNMRADDVKQVRSQNITPVDLNITAHDRAAMNGHTGGVIWFTGLSGAGKSTLALELQQRLFEKGYQTYVLDGDNIRRGLNGDLGFAPEDRSENIRRVGEVAALFADSGMIVISSFISPYEKDRHLARSAAPQYFHEVHIKASVETCEQRDVKGLYAKARAGEIKEFTGISAPYEEPERPEIVVDTENQSIEESIAQLEAYVEKHFVAPAQSSDNKPRDYSI